MVIDLEGWSEVPLWEDLRPGYGPSKWQLYRNATMNGATAACHG